jgi:hypothetical protein
MTSEGLWEIFEGDSADMCAGKFPQVSMGGRAEGLGCAGPRERGRQVVIVDIFDSFGTLGHIFEFLIYHSAGWKLFVGDILTFLPVKYFETLANLLLEKIVKSPEEKEKIMSLIASTTLAWPQGSACTLPGQ